MNVMCFVKGQRNGEMRTLPPNRLP